MHWSTVLALLLFTSPSFSAEPLTKRAADFVANGAAVALKMCDLPRRRCNGKPLAIKAVQSGESNDEKRSVETLAQAGMAAEVIFVAERRSTYYLATLKLTTSQWQTIDGLRVGSPEKFVFAVLGLPNNGVRGSCRYYFREEIESQAVVCFKAGRVSSIRWEYFVD